MIPPYLENTCTNKVYESHPTRKRDKRKPPNTLEL